MQINHNLLSGLDLEQGTTSVRLPWGGNYIFTADITGGTVTVNGQEVVDGKLSITGLDLDSEVSIVVPEGCTVANASLTLDVSTIPNKAPTAKDVSFTGILHSGRTLTGSYTFSDTDEGQGGKEGNTTFCWLSADAKDGEYTPIQGETGKTLMLTDAMEGKYIKLQVTPVDGYGKEGAPAVSEAQGPVDINDIRNPSLEIEGLTSPEGWTSQMGATMPNDSDKAHDGFRYVKIPAGNSSAVAFYTADISESAYYTFGAWVKTPEDGGVLGVRDASTGEILGRVELTASQEYSFISGPKIALEEGTTVQVFIQGSETCGEIWADDFQLLRADSNNLPAFVNLLSFQVENACDMVVDPDEHTITFHVPFGTDPSQLVVSTKVSQGAQILPAFEAVTDFTKPVSFTISNGDKSAQWTAICVVDEEKLSLRSDNETLQEGFNWAVDKMDQFVMTDKKGLINKSEMGDGTGPVAYMPSYWAGYYDRTAFYGRDFVHQAVGGQIAGLWNENWNMFHTFADFASEDLKWYTGWAFNFDGSIYELDFRNENSFVREVPAQFELVEKAYKQYLWSGDKRYIEDETMWNFYTKVMTDFVELHDTNGNGIAEGTGGGIFQGSCTYNERYGQPIIEAGDAIGSQYQATLAYAAMLKARGEEEKSQQWFDKAAELKRYFNEEWSVMPDDDGTGRYARALGTDKQTKYNDFGKENSWFMPMKQITEPGERTDAYLDFIMEEVGDHIGDKYNSPSNIEAWTYLPDTFFPYNRANDAWKYMKYILSVKDDPHERPSQGTNGDYPEISFTTVSHTIEGMMGVEPDAAAHWIATSPRLPDEVGYVEADHISIGEHLFDLRHDGLTKSTLTNRQGADVTWEARFYGDFEYINVDGTPVKAQHKEINGVQVSYITTTVPTGGTVTCQAIGIISPVTVIGSYAENSGAGEYEAGQIVTIQAGSRSGYDFAGWTAEGVTLKDSSSATTTFVMPENAVSVTASWDKRTSGGGSSSSGDYQISVDKTTGGKVTVTPGRADKGDTITIRVTPDEDYELDELVVTDKSGKSVKLTNTGDGTYTFTMPGSQVTVEATFVKTHVSPADAFVDVPAGAWYYDAVGYAVENGLMSGTGSRTFQPDATLSRGMIAQMLYALEGKPAVSSVNGFKDVSADDWYAKAANWAQSKGIITGYAGALFKANDPLTREQLALILFNYAKLNGYDTSAAESLSRFGDGASTSAWAKDAVSWAVGAGLLSGKGAGMLYPTGTATRAEVAQIMMNFCENIVK